MAAGFLDGPGLLVWVVIAELLVFALASAVEVVSTFLWTVVGQGMVFDLTGTCSRVCSAAR